MTPVYSQKVAKLLGKNAPISPSEWSRSKIVNPFSSAASSVSFDSSQGSTTLRKHPPPIDHDSCHSV